MARKGIDWQEKSIEMPEWIRGKVFYWQAPDFDNKNPTILMIHGFRGDHHGLLFIADSLAAQENTQENAQKKNKHNIILIDLPAFGKSGEFLDRRSHTATHYADFIAAFLEKLKLKTPIITAHSFGTTITSRLLARHSSKINRKVILLSPIARRPQSFFGTNVINSMANFLGGLPEDFSHSIAGSWLVADFVSFNWSSDRRSKVYEEVIKPEHRQYFTVFSSTEAMVSSFKSSNTDSIADVIADLTRADKDFLIISGTKDKLAFIEDVRWLNEQLRGRLVEINNIGHLIHYEAYEDVASHMKRFLEK